MEPVGEVVVQLSDQSRRSDRRLVWDHMSAEKQALSIRDTVGEID